MKKETWKPVTISGFTGILMGAASAYGMQKIMNGEESVSAMDAESVDYDSMSFKDAFEAARAEMGPGHVFTWHGNLYNTYTAAEWAAKTPREQQEIAEQVENQLASAEPEATQEPSANEETTPADDVRVVANNVVVDEQETATVQTTGDDVTTDDTDVRIIGSGEMQLENGRTITVEDLEMNGQRVRIIDVDQDGVADIAMSDLNHNFQPDEGEVIDLHTGEALSFTNDTDEPSEVLSSFDV